MILLREDIERLESLGYKDFYEFRDGFYRLKNANGRCIFLDPERGICKVYEYRPLGCRIYPLIYDEEVGVTIDPECPLRERLPKSWIARAAKDLEKFLRRLEAEYGYKVNWNLLKKSLQILLSK
jgi:hypothetical protein